jgi:hypothetical protein
MALRALSGKPGSPENKMRNPSVTNKVPISTAVLVVCAYKNHGFELPTFTTKLKRDMNGK